MRGHKKLCEKCGSYSRRCFKVKVGIIKYFEKDISIYKIYCYKCTKDLANQPKDI